MSAQHAVILGQRDRLASLSLPAAWHPVLGLCGRQGLCCAQLFLEREMFGRKGRVASFTGFSVTCKTESRHLPVTCKARPKIQRVKTEDSGTDLSPSSITFGQFVSLTIPQFSYLCSGANTIVPIQ